LEHCLKIAEQNGIKKLLLYSNRKLLPAIYLYIKFGFQEVPLEDGVYERADIKMEKNMY
jgi:ribosomal protein S18 acetylase RimI-like enzyme